MRRAQGGGEKVRGYVGGYFDNVLLRDDVVLEAIVLWLVVPAERPRCQLDRGVRTEKVWPEHLAHCGPGREGEWVYGGVWWCMGVYGGVWGWMSCVKERARERERELDKNIER